MGSCEHGNEPSDSIKGRKFLDQLSGHQLLKQPTLQNQLVCSLIYLTTLYQRLRLCSVEWGI